MDNQMNFFEAFGLGSEEDFFGTAKKETKPVAKKEEKKAPAKDAGKEKKAEAAKKAVKDFSVKLPVTVKSRTFKATDFAIDGKTEAKASEVWEELKKAYPVFEISRLGLAYSSEANCLFVCDNVGASEDGTAVFETEDDVVKVVDGGLAVEYGPSEWSGLDPDEITLGEIRDKFVDANPSYKGCELYFDSVSKAAYPVLKYVTKKKGESVEVCCSGQTETVDGGEVSERFGVTDVVNASLRGGTGKVFVSWSVASAAQKAGNYYCPGESSADAAKTKQAEKKYALPFSLIVVNFNQTYELSSDMFDGKEKVTKSEITQAMSKVDSFFGEKDRKVEYLFNEKTNAMSCMFVSGTKGMA